MPPETARSSSSDASGAPTVGDGKVVSIHYTLQDAAGRVLDSSPDGSPADYLHGAGNIVPGLESELAGKGIGARCQVRVEPAQGYGERDPQMVHRFPKDAFPADFEFEPGMQFGAELEDGEVRPVWVREVGVDDVTVDFNHPLAGETLHFDVTIAGVRDATAAELEHGHPHGDHECGHDHAHDHAHGDAHAHECGHDHGPAAAEPATDEPGSCGPGCCRH